jgi:hemerythrin-like domain-containing protein
MTNGAIAMPNALSLLRADHKAVRAMLEQLSTSTERAAKKRVELLKQIEQELLVHAQLEEQLFYPAYLESVGKKQEQKLFYEALEEHKATRMVLAELKKAEPASPEFAARAKVLMDMVLHHIREEERDMFKNARASMQKERLEELGEQIQERKQQLLNKRMNGRADRSANA